MSNRKQLIQNLLPYNSEIKKAKNNSSFKWIFLYMITAGSVYFFSEAIQVSPLISKSSHDKITSFQYSYNFIYSMLVVYFLINISNVVNKQYPNYLLYIIFFHLGSVGFALLGEIPSLKNIVIVNGFWKHLNTTAKITFLFIGSIILYLGIRQLYRAYKDKDLKNHLIPYIIFISVYLTTIISLINSGATSIIFHVHHAIFAGLLSLWFTDWYYCSTSILHAILMGVVVEGINFFGIGELSLFMSKNGYSVNLDTSLYVWLIYIIISILSLFTYKCIYKI